MDKDQMQLISDKISLPARMPRVPRVRLLNSLHASLASSASTIIYGRAGTGKTFLATDFSRRCARRVAWYKVDSSDADLQVFLEYLVASVATAERKRFVTNSLQRL